MANKIDRCKNCGKLKPYHYKSIEKEYRGEWCYPRDKHPPSDERYSMKFDAEVSGDEQNE